MCQNGLFVTPKQFREALHDLGLSQAEFARLLDVSPRSVTRWASDGGEEAPGPVRAYLRVMQMAPAGLRGVEVARGRGPSFKEGIYQLVFQGIDGFGAGTLVFSKGRVWGADSGGVRYDGDYTVIPEERRIVMHITLSIPEGGHLVTGVDLPPGYNFEIHESIPFFDREVTTTVTTPFGPVGARLTFLRDIA